MTTLAKPNSLTILPDPPAPPTAIGLIAGGGRLPIRIAESLIAQGHQVHGLGIAGQYDPELRNICNTFREVGLMRVATWGKLLAKRGVRHAIMVGKVDKAKLMHDPARALKNFPDVPTAMKWLKELRHDRRSHAVLKAVADLLDGQGVSLLDSTAPIPDELATPGVMTNAQPTAAQQADYLFAWPMLVEMLRLDVGQALSVRDRDIVAVEAVEGTDRMIERTGELCRAKGWTLCKGARAGHDRRSDVPTIGVLTIENLHRAGGRCLALAAGDVIMIDKAQVLDLADELGVSIVGVPSALSTSEHASDPL